jgi:hypothetical protein
MKIRILDLPHFQTLTHPFGRMPDLATITQTNFVVSRHVTSGNENASVRFEHNRMSIGSDRAISVEVALMNRRVC